MSELTDFNGAERPADAAGGQEETFYVYIVQRDETVRARLEFPADRSGPVATVETTLRQRVLMKVHLGHRVGVPDGGREWADFGDEVGSAEGTEPGEPETGRRQRSYRRTRRSEPGIGRLCAAEDAPANAGAASSRDDHEAAGAAWSGSRHRGLEPGCGP